MESLPRHLDICEVLCLTQGGWPPQSCRYASFNHSQEASIRRHLNHVMVIRGASHQIDINTISNFLMGNNADFAKRLRKLLQRSHGVCSWQCCPSSSIVFPSKISGDLQEKAPYLVRTATSTMIANRLRPRHADGVSNRQSNDRRTPKAAKAGRVADETRRNSVNRLPNSELTEMQYITRHRIKSTGAYPMIQLCCHMKGHANIWFPESTVQKVSNAAVCTFWGCGPEPWKRPGPDSVPPQPLKVLGQDPANQRILLQMVGHAASDAQWISVDEVNRHWESFYDSWCVGSTVMSAKETSNPTTLSPGDKGDLQTIVGHRLEEDDDAASEFQLSCQWTSGLETWEYEEDIQRQYNAAVLTYWNSDPEAREGKIPDRYLKFVSHDTRSGNLEVQWLGASACQHETTMVTPRDAEENWPSGYRQYAEQHCLGKID